MQLIRAEAAEDIDAIRRVNERAFGQPEEAAIVDRIRRDHSPEDLVSLVAVERGDPVAHILFSPAAAHGPRGTVVGMGLAPMGVLPEYQRRGIGSLLVRRGLEIVRDRGCPFAIVLGHPEFYPRFGFRPASVYGCSCQWEGIPDEVFMMRIFDEAAMRGVGGVVSYAQAFADAV